MWKRKNYFHKMNAHTMKWKLFSPTDFRPSFISFLSSHLSGLTSHQNHSNLFFASYFMLFCIGQFLQSNDAKHLLTRLIIITHTNWFQFLFLSSRLRFARENIREKQNHQYHRINNFLFIIIILLLPLHVEVFWRKE